MTETDVFMNANNFITQKPNDHLLARLVDYYFFVDIPVSELTLAQEYVIPFPRITFGYFFDHPFLVTNQDLDQSITVDMVISRISTDKITVQPKSDRVKIIGAHVRPYALAFLTDQPIGDLPWLINTVDLFQEKAISFKSKINRCSIPEEMFEEIENIFLKTLLIKDLSVITKAVDIIEERFGEVKLKELAEQLSVSERTLRNQFHKFIGCAPKEYVHLVKLKYAVYQMRFSGGSLTNIAHEGEYFDQAHFNHTVKKITGKAPKKLQKEMADFRFLQF